MKNAVRQYDALQTSYDAAAWRASYLSADQTAELRYAVTAAGQYAFAVGYAQSGATPSSVSTNLCFESIRLQSEPVTSETDPATGFVRNPSGMPLGAEDRFKISITAGTVPESDITWAITSGAGNVSFVNDVNTGPEVAVHADAVGSFTLEADVKGLVITPPHVRPFFTGQVLPAVNVPVTVFIVRDNLGVVSARAPSDIPNLLTGANTILRQRGITLVLNGEPHFLNNSNWLNHVDILSTNAPSIDSMMDSTNSMGNSVELYFVQSLDGDQVDGVCRNKGIAIALSGDAVVIAHETLHAGGTEDIYTVEDPDAPNPNPIPGTVSQGRLPSDWGGGYYPQELTQRELVGWLIMRSGGERGVDLDLSQRRDLPNGTILGWKHIGDGASPKTLGQAGVGQSSIQNVPRSY